MLLLRFSLLLTFASLASAQTFVGPLPYLSTADVPANFHSGSFVVEDFEDGRLTHGLVLQGNVVNPGSITDSVDGDDGVIDGFGTGGHSWFGSGPITITFPAAVTSAGVVWTDGPVGTPVTFAAFGPGMVPLGSIGPFTHADNTFAGTTAEDRFYGVQHAGGIIAIVLHSTAGNETIELDHVQFDSPGTNYCSPAVPNSTGAPGVITAYGSSAVADNDLSLVASQLPDNQFGFFIVSETQGSFMPASSQGFVCLSGNIGRFNGAAHIIQGATGMIPVDLTSIPVSPVTAVQAGDTWNFQCWYRDDNPGPTNNFTDAVSVTFL